MDVILASNLAIGRNVDSGLGLIADNGVHCGIKNAVIDGGQLFEVGACVLAV